MTSCKEIMLERKKVVLFADMTPDQQQAWVDFVAHEIERHRQDIRRSEDELSFIQIHHGIRPRNLFVGVWIEVK